MRLPRWTPCFANPDDFDCGDCEIGFMAHCALRTDETLRSYHSAMYSERHSGGLNLTEIGRIASVAAAVMGLGDLALPASLIRERMGKVGSDLTDDQVGVAIRSLPSIRESSPGMFQLAGRIETAENSHDEAPIRSGSEIARNVVASLPPGHAAQARLFRRLAGVRLGVTFSGSPEGLVQLDEMIGDLADVVLPEERWTISDALSFATGSRVLAVSRRGTSPDRTAFLTALSAHELLQRMSIDELWVEHDRLTAQALVDNQRLTASIALGYCVGGFPGFADLFQVGMIGLHRAVERFDPYRGFAFSTFASPWIRQGISRTIADSSRTIRLPVHMVESLNRVMRAAAMINEENGGRNPTFSAIAERIDREAVRREFVRDHGREPSVAELADGVERVAPRHTASRVREILDAEQHLASLDVQLRDAFDDPAAEPADPMEVDQPLFRRATLVDPKSMSTVDLVERLELRYEARAVLEELTPRERQVLELRTGLNDDRVRTLEEIGREFSLTRERIRQIEAKAIKKLKHPSRAHRLRSYRQVTRRPAPRPSGAQDWAPESSSERSEWNPDLAHRRASARIAIADHAISQLHLVAVQRTRLQWLLSAMDLSADPLDDSAGATERLAAIYLGASGRPRTDRNVSRALIAARRRGSYALFNAITSTVVDLLIRDADIFIEQIIDTFGAEHLGHACPTVDALSESQYFLREYATGVRTGLRSTLGTDYFSTPEAQLVATIIAGIRQVS